MSRVGLLTVGETARILGVSASTLRLWENVGLISPVRSNGRYRLYSPELLDVLKRIKYLVATLQRLAAAYGTTVLTSYDLPKHSKRLVRPCDRRAIQMQSGVKVELLSTGAQESMLFRVKPAAKPRVCARRTLHLSCKVVKCRARARRRAARRELQDVSPGTAAPPRSDMRPYA